MLGAVARTLFPHAFVEAEVYAQAAMKMEDRAGSEPGLASALDAALEQLPLGFPELSAPAREAALETLAGTPFFKLARQASLAAVYTAASTWAALGYPGPSAPFGGYIDQPLVDLPWLTSLGT